MGNTVPPRMCRKEPAAAAVTPRGRRPKNAEPAAPGAAPTRVAVCARKQREAAAEEDTTRRRAGSVSWADGAVVGKASAAATTGMTVKIVLKRKDAEALVARLNAQSALVAMAELKGEFRAGDSGGSGASPAPGRDAWKPRLAPIKEN